MSKNLQNSEFVLRLPILRDGSVDFRPESFRRAAKMWKKRFPLVGKKPQAKQDVTTMCGKLMIFSGVKNGKIL